MNTMNAALALNQFNQFEQLARRDTAYLSLAQSVRGYAMLWLKILVVISMGWLFLLIAQFVPRIFRKHLNYIYPALPYIQDKKSLEWLKDTFQLYYFSLKGYRSVALNKKSFDIMMEELDEHIDSLSYVLENHEMINGELKELLNAH